MIMLFLLVAALIGVNLIIVKKVTNKPIKYSLIAIFSVMAIGLLWVIYLATTSGEM